MKSTYSNRIDSQLPRLQGASQLEPVELQKFPYPYQAGFTVASDIDSASALRFRAIHSLLCQNSLIRQNTPEWRTLGLTTKSGFYVSEEGGIRGLGLPLADSFFLVGDATTFGMYRYRSEETRFVEDSEDGQSCRNLIQRWIKEGQIDSFHAFLHYTRTQIEPLLRDFYDWCEDAGATKPTVWINHSAGVTPTGLCPKEIQPNSFKRFARWGARRVVDSLVGRSPLTWKQAFMRYDGATPGSPCYINDVLARNGLKFVWLNMDDLHLNRPNLPEQLSRGRQTILRPVTMDDGVRYYRFERCYGRAQTSAGDGAYLRDSNEGCDTSSLISERNLQQLCDSNGTCVLYTHWTHHRSMPISDETIGRFQLLRQWQQAGKVWVAPTGRLLEWTRRRTFVDYTISKERNKLLIEIKGVDDPIFGYEPVDSGDLDGLSFRVTPEDEISVAVGGRLLLPTEIGRAGNCLWLNTKRTHPEHQVPACEWVEAS